MRIETKRGNIDRNAEPDMRILIAEDDPTSRKLLAAVLEKSGHEVVLSSNGAEALEAARQPGAPRLLILDWMMPEMDGFEVCRQVRAMESDDPPYIMLLTALGDEEHLVAGLNEGADDYITKPFKTKELLARVEVASRIVALQTRLAQEASVDSLTGVANRASILRTLERELACARRTNSQVGLAILDIDFFKNVNDTLGHAGGDEVLREFAIRCAQTLRMRDALGRYGGEEFLIVAPGYNANGPLWERIREHVAATPFSAGTSQIQVTVSVGASCGLWSDSPQALIEAADKALYCAKRNGRNRVEHELLREESGADLDSGAGSEVAKVGPPKLRPRAIPRALIAEEEGISRNILEGMLGKFGFQTAIVNSGTEIEKALQNRDLPTAVFMACQLSGLDGLETCEAIRALNIEPPPFIVMLCESGQATDALDAGANDFIMRPYQLDEIRARAGVALHILEIQAHLAEKDDELRRAHDGPGGV